VNRPRIAVMADDIDDHLLRRFVHGDRDAFERLFRQFQRDVHRWILRIVRDPAAADDATVETFWRAHRSRARFDPTRSFGAWLRRIASHAAIDQLKQVRRHAWISLDGATQTMADEGLQRASQPGGVTGPEQLYASADLRAVIVRAFRALPPKLQAVAALALIEEQPLAEIADALDVPIGTVKSRLFRATRLLREELVRMGVHT
jgi:RNA polymerase sigma-70 factor (ECF subfamily)